MDFDEFKTVFSAAAVAIRADYAKIPAFKRMYPRRGTKIKAIISEETQLRCTGGINIDRLGVDIETLRAWAGDGLISLRADRHRHPHSVALRKGN